MLTTETTPKPNNRKAGYHYDPTAEYLTEKLKKLYHRASHLEQGVIDGDIEQRREFYICMQKIEVTENRLKNNFVRLETAAIVPAFTQIR